MGHERMTTAVEQKIGKKLLSAKELAEFLGVQINKLAVWRMTGDGPRFLKLGDGSRAAVRYRVRDVEDWLESRVRRSTSDPGDWFG